MHRPSAPAIAVIVLMVVVGLPALYLASVFPAHKSVLSGQMSFEAFDFIYAPLLWLKDRWPTLQEFLNLVDGWYRGED